MFNRFCFAMNNRALPYFIPTFNDIWGWGKVQPHNALINHCLEMQHSISFRRRKRSYLLNHIIFYCFETRSLISNLLSTLWMGRSTTKFDPSVESIPPPPPSPHPFHLWYSLIDFTHNGFCETDKDQKYIFCPIARKT